MAAPINTYNSPTDLSIGHIPQGADDNPELYSELLDIHNALEILLTSSDDADAIFAAFIAKFRNFSKPPITSNYTVLITDGLIRVDASAGDIIITMHPIAEGVGYSYDIKRIDEVPANKVTIIGDGLELIDSHTDGVDLYALSSYNVKANNIGWDIK